MCHVTLRFISQFELLALLLTDLVVLTLLTPRALQMRRETLSTRTTDVAELR